MPELGPDDTRELAALARGIDFADGFALFFARVDARPARRALVAALRSRLDERLEVVEVEVPADTTDLESLLARRLADAPTDAERAVFVYGLEDVLSEARSDERDAFLRVLNFKRENIQRAVPHPVVLWVPEFALRILATEAPDLWAWRSSVLEFSSPRDDVEQTWRQLEQGGTADEYARMTPAARRDRIRTLEALYHDYSERDDADQPGLLRIRFDLSDRLGRLYRDMADVVRAEQHARQALRLAEQLSDESSISLASNNLGRVLHDRRDLDSAEDAFRRALAISEAAYGPDPPDVAIRVNSLGGVLHDRGDLDGAEDAYRRALTISEAAYGPDHPDVAVPLNNLASVLYDRGDLDGAEDAYRRALTISEAAYGPDHPTVAIRLNNLGLVLHDRGDLDGAEDAYRRALSIHEATYGPNHPTVAIDVYNLGYVILDRADLDAAGDAFRRALTIFETVLGPDHPNAQTVRANLVAVQEAAVPNSNPPASAPTSQPAETTSQGAEAEVQPSAPRSHGDESHPQGSEARS